MKFDLAAKAHYVFFYKLFSQCLPFKVSKGTK